LTELVDKDEWVMPKVSGVKLLPSFTRMVDVSGECERVVARAGDRDGTGSKATMNDRGRGASEWLFFIHITKKDVSEGGDVEEVEHVMVLLDVGFLRFTLRLLGSFPGFFDILQVGFYCWNVRLSSGLVNSWGVTDKEIVWCFLCCC
jgi:hypothetical protein